MMERLFTSADIGQVNERLSLAVSLKCYRCDLMERKIFGFKTISDVIDGVWYGKAVWLTSDFLAKWLVVEHVAEDIFDTGSSVCIPVVERAADVRFCIEMKILQQKIKICLLKEMMILGRAGAAIPGAGEAAGLVDIALGLVLLSLER